MDGSFCNKTLPEGLIGVVENVTTLSEVKERVRCWAGERGYFPCAVSVHTDAVVVAYHDSTLGCRQVRLSVGPTLAAQFSLEFLARDCGW